MKKRHVALSATGEFQASATDVAAGEGASTAGDVIEDPDSPVGTRRVRGPTDAVIGIHCGVARRTAVHPRKIAAVRADRIACHGALDAFDDLLDAADMRTREVRIASV